MVDRHPRMLVATMRITTNTTPPETDTLGGQSEYWLNHLVVVIAAGKRPASIPNLEAKPASADGTAPGRVWESRTPPQQPSKGGVLGTHVPKAPPLYVYPQDMQQKSLAAGACKTISGAALFFAYAPLIAISTCKPIPLLANTTQTYRTLQCLIYAQAVHVPHEHRCCEHMQSRK